MPIQDCAQQTEIYEVYHTIHQLLEPMQRFLGDPESGLLNLEEHCLALTIAKKTR